MFYTKFYLPSPIFCLSSLTFTVDLSSKVFCGIQLKKLKHKISLKITLLQLQSQWVKLKSDQPELYWTVHHIRLFHSHLIPGHVSLVSTDIPTSGDCVAVYPPTHASCFLTSGWPVVQSITHCSQCKMAEVWQTTLSIFYCPACQTSLIATRFWVVVICPIIKCLTVLEFSFILFDLCLFITIFNFILNYVPIVTFWIFTYHKIWILLIIFCFIWSYWIIYFLTCLEVFWSVVTLGIHIG